MLGIDEEVTVNDVEAAGSDTVQSMLMPAPSQAVA
jgi:hypothetical protein